MAQAIMDPEKVRRFADELQRFNTDLENRMISLNARFSALGDTWQDQEHEKFGEEFKLAMKALKKFIEMSHQHTPYLLRTPSCDSSSTWLRIPPTSQTRPSRSSR